MGSTSGRWKVVGAIGTVLLALAAGAIVLAQSRGPEPAPTGPTEEQPPSPSISATPTPHYELTVALGRVTGTSVDGTVRPPSLREPAEAIRHTMTDLYTAGFVDPTLWDDGRFPTFLGFFASAARDGAEEDLQELTLGRSARELSAVRPDHARLNVRFVTDPQARPVEAFADMQFAGTGIAEGAEVNLWNDGRYVLRKLSGDWRIVAYEAKGRVPSVAEIHRKVQTARFSPGIPSNDLLFVLAIGSDARPGQSVTGARGDSLHIIGVNPDMGVASVVGIPRDSYVPIPGHGTGKINSALVFGGPDLMVRTVEQLTGIHIDAYVVTGFDGFERLVAAVGGIEVRIPYPMHDPFSKAFFKPGKTRLGGKEALQFSRDRHDAPGGDFGRSLNQGSLIIAALRELKEDFLKDPVGLVRWVIAGAKYVRTDLTLSEMGELLLAAPSIDANRVKNKVVSGTGDTVGGASVVRLGAKARAIFRDLARDAWLGG